MMGVMILFGNRKTETKADGKIKDTKMIKDAYLMFAVNCWLVLKTGSFYSPICLRAQFF